MQQPEIRGGREGTRLIDERITNGAAARRSSLDPSPRANADLRATRSMAFADVRDWTGEEIAALRRQCGRMSQADLARDLSRLSAEVGEAVSVHKLTVSRWERAIAQPSPFYAWLLTAYFGRLAARLNRDLSSMAEEAVMRCRAPL